MASTSLVQPQSTSSPTISVSPIPRISSDPDIHHKQVPNSFSISVPIEDVSISTSPVHNRVTPTSITPALMVSTRHHKAISEGKSTMTLEKPFELDHIPTSPLFVARQARGHCRSRTDSNYESMEELNL